MSIGLNGWRLAGVMTLLPVQMVVAAGMAFCVNVHFDEVYRYQRHLQLYPKGAYAEDASNRVRLETGGMIAAAVATIGISGVVLVSTAKLSAPSFIRTVHRFSAWTCFGFAALFLTAAIMTPRVGSAHDDMLPGVPAYASTLFAVLAGLASVIVARLARVREPNPQ